MDKSHVHIIYLDSSYHTAEAVATKSNGRNEVLVRGDGFAPPGLLVRRLSQSKIGAVSAPICPFCRCSLGGFSVVSDWSACFFRVLGKKWVRHNSVIKNPIINIESVICAEGDYCISKSLIKYLIACSLS